MCVCVCRCCSGWCAERAFAAVVRGKWWRMKGAMWKRRRLPVPVVFTSALLFHFPFTSSSLMMSSPSSHSVRPTVLLLLYIVAVVVELNECGSIPYKLCSIRWYSPYLWIKYERARTHSPRQAFVVVHFIRGSLKRLAEKLASHHQPKPRRIMKYFRLQCVRRRALWVRMPLPSYFVVISKPPSNLFKLASTSVKCKRWCWREKKMK